MIRSYKTGGEQYFNYRGTSLIRKRYPIGPYRRPMPRVLGGSLRGGAVSYE